MEEIQFEDITVNHDDEEVSSDEAIDADPVRESCRKCKDWITKKNSYFCHGCEARFCAPCFLASDLVVKRNPEKHKWECSFCQEEEEVAKDWIVPEAEETVCADPDESYADSEQTDSTVTDEDEVEDEEDDGSSTKSSNTTTTSGGGDHSESLTL